MNKCTNCVVVIGAEQLVDYNSLVSIQWMYRV